MDLSEDTRGTSLDTNRTLLGKSSGDPTVDNIMKYITCAGQWAWISSSTDEQQH